MSAGFAIARDRPFGQVPAAVLRGALLIGTVSGFYALLSLSVPIFDNIAFHRVVVSNSHETLLLAATICAICMTGYAILEYVRAAAAMAVVAQVTGDVTGPALEAALEQARTGDPDTVARSVRDLTELRNFATSSAPLLPFDLLWSPLFIVILFAMHPLFGWYTLFSAAVIIAFGLASDTLARRQVAGAAESVSALLARVSGALRNAEVIEGSGMTASWVGYWERRLEDNLVRQDRSEYWLRRFGALNGAVRLLLGVWLGCLAAWLVLAHEAPSISVLITSLLSSRALTPYGTAVGNLRSLINAFAAAGRLRRLLAGPARPAAPATAIAKRDAAQSDGAAAQAVPPRLAFDGVGFRAANGRPILEDITFALEAGDILGVIGPSGSGKTTLARLMTGVLQPSGGRIAIDGDTALLDDDRARGRAIGYLPQDVQLIDGSVMENIARFTAGVEAQAVAAAEIAEAHAMIGRLPAGYDTPVVEGGFGLSGGQSQRVALARALLGEPRLLVLDEPNANLDRDGEQALIEAIRASARQGAAVVVISHRLTLLQAVTRLLVLRDGRIAQLAARTAGGGGRR